MQDKNLSAVQVAETYYDSEDASRFYELVWGGEDIHIGLYDSPGTSIAAASSKAVASMARRLTDLRPGARILDLGSGYGGAARYLADHLDCTVLCVNLSERQNLRNRALNRERNYRNRIEVLHGSFEDIPLADRWADAIWSQDSFLHSTRRQRVIDEIDRVLTPGGHLLFTDPMQSDDCPPHVLKGVCERLKLESLASPAWYRQEFARAGFEELEWCDLTPQLANHYAAVRSSLREHYDMLRRDISTAYMDRMLVGLDNWVSAAHADYLRWGIFHFRKAGAA
jgi:cyclopropane fatty-acyl-phospholipid synthase-like methyltransferase